MNLVILVILTLAAILGLFWLMKKKKKPEEEIPSYVCPECGARHCNCYLEKKDK